MDKHQAVAQRLLTAAAKWMCENPSAECCCQAIGKYSGTEYCTCGYDGESPCAIVIAKDAFRLFSPDGNARGYWFGKPGGNRHERALALLFAAEIASDLTI